MSIKSVKALGSMELMVLELKGLWRGAPALTGPLSLVATIYYASRRPDLDESLLMDALQRAGCIGNDRQIWHKDVTKRIDPQWPRVVCELRPYVDETEALG